VPGYNVVSTRYVMGGISFENMDWMRVRLLHNY
jgi:hypothetical protein